ncbi:lipoate--protein ligase family protein [Roseiconus nitratireducens]|uniref:Lipoate--protein ligase family protein n=1 Tax=Roseiconus nitratireducens TaxID=2605748 RepID=A0A5M6DDJ5_9BACT|nr:biotin/lipoate A/B protein ligase family protein [Roseiconus nitratireducens]KAA5544536.1 lipoate--protein ligase family protein [Roseiconus nitratireducens]
MTAESVGRLLPFRRGDAAWNMALDQALLESVDRTARQDGRAAATLRFYGWKTATLSLGYFQSSEPLPPTFRNVAQVRRSTGGGAILHHHELTYSLTYPIQARDSGARMELYRGVHAAIAQVLAERSISARPHRLDSRLGGDADAFLCFQRRTDEDLIVSGYKVLGSAQRRMRQAVLQHGSLLLRVSRHAPELPGLFELTSIDLDVEKLSEQIARQLGQTLGIRFAADGETEQERTSALQIVADRFASDRWWNRH